MYAPSLPALHCISKNWPESPKVIVAHTFSRPAFDASSRHLAADDPPGIPEGTVLFIIVLTAAPLFHKSRSPDKQNSGQIMPELGH
jgi:hypothetical protein